MRLATLGSLQLGATHVLVHHFDPGLFLGLLESERATVTGAVPTMLVALMEHPNFSRRATSRPSGSCRRADPWSPRRSCDASSASWASRTARCSGQTEASPGITQTRPEDDAVDKAETVGIPLDHISVKIVDPGTGAVVPCGVAGELCARSPMAMSGYDGMPEETAATIDADGWLHTGDLCTMDQQHGYCRIVGRLKDMVTRGGGTSTPREIEDVIFDHPAVAEVAVVGVPDDRYGEQLAAVIRPAAGHELDPVAPRSPRGPHRQAQDPSTLGCRGLHAVDGHGQDPEARAPRHAARATRRGRVFNRSHALAPADRRFGDDDDGRRRRMSDVTLDGHVHALAMAEPDPRVLRGERRPDLAGNCRPSSH